MLHGSRRRPFHGFDSHLNSATDGVITCTSSETQPCLLRQLALLADGAVVARQGDTMVTVSVVSNRNQMDESGFLPLSVEYREKVGARQQSRHFLLLPAACAAKNGHNTWESNSDRLIAGSVVRELREARFRCI